jgi:hypothetical protein
MKLTWHPPKLFLLSFFYILFAANSSCNEEHKPTTETCFEVAYIPSQCADEHSGVIGLVDQSGKYLMVHSPQNPLEDFQIGERLNVEFDTVQHCIVCEACICPKPDFCITPKNVKKCQQP